MPFADLRSEESQSRLSTCAPFSAFETSTSHGGVPRYSHICGDCNFRRRATRTLSSMMGFILNKNDGSHIMQGLKPAELRALHECLTWSRQGNNNKVLRFFGTVFESFTTAAGQLMDKIKTVLPEGSTKCRIRFSARETHDPTTGTLLDTLGEETSWPISSTLKYTPHSHCNAQCH